MPTHLNETWSKTIEGVDYVFFRTFLPLALKEYYGFTSDYAGGANGPGGDFIFAAEFATMPEQADVEAELPL